ncbi:putative phospholipid ABC transporter-binding protein MlaD [mine drainage metagenome]|uniref:Putative phospholipid ABC transporter-binding protein MlaD n=1 Tax=mine drainage metagenome TaxID=410659 RepID=A0A1J5QVE4_9ZZZZ
MLASRQKETLIGACVLLLGALVLGMAYRPGREGGMEGYNLQARFNKADGVGIGSDIRLSGVSVGKVVRQTLDGQFRAVLTLRLRPDVQVPDDSAAVIRTDGLLGAKFIAIVPGGDEANLKPGQSFDATQDSVNVLDLLEQIIAQGESNRAKQQAATPR